MGTSMSSSSGYMSKYCLGASHGVCYSARYRIDNKQIEKKTLDTYIQPCRLVVYQSTNKTNCTLYNMFIYMHIHTWN